MNTQFDLSELLKILPGSVYWKNCDGVYLGCNEHMLNMVGLKSLKEIIGKTDYDLSWKKQADALRKIDQKVMKTGKELTVEETGSLANGKLATYLTTKKPLRNKKQEIIGVLGFSVDITSHKQVELVLKEANTRANAVINEKQNFLAKMNQEVMGPSADKRPKSLEDYVKGMRAYLENIIACMPANVYWMDKNCVYLGCNNNTAKLLNLKSRSEIVGKNYDYLAKVGHWADGQADSFRRDDIEVITTGVPKLNIEEPPLPGPDGKPIYYLTSRVPLFDEQEEVIGVVGISVDITDRKKIEWELIESKTRAESANRAKTEFLSMISHELRIPLSGILGMARLLRLNDLQPTQKEQVGDIVKAGEHLLSLINDLLDVAKLEAGKMELHEATVDFRKLLEEVVTLLTYQAKAKNIELLLNYDEDVPHVVFSDARALRQIAINLAGNAIKFTESGYVHIHVKCEKKAENSARLMISITDSGPGIPKDKLETIFQRFEQGGDAVYARAHGGTGLGLTITKSYIELMGGKVLVESEVGKGSTFSCSIPFHLPDISVVTSPWEAYKSNVRILIVDDTLRGEVLQRHLASSNVEVVPGKEALQTLLSAEKSNSPFNVVIVDQQLTSADAMKLGIEIRDKLQTNPPMPLLLMDSNKISNKQAAIAAGYFETMTKPTQPTELLVTLTAAWEKWAEKFVSVKVEPVKALRKPKTLLVEDDHIVQRVHMSMLQHFGCEVDLAEDGLQALDKYHANTYDMIFMDVGLPKKTGLQVTEEIREKENGTKHTPIVGVTGFAHADSREACLKSGMDDVTTKPMDFPDLQKLLEQWLPKERLQETKF